MIFDLLNRQTMNRMTNRPRRGVFLLVLPVLIATAPLSMEAQDDVKMVRTLVIKDSQVLIDGRRVDPGELPSAVQLDGISVSYSFIGVDMPVVTIGERLYAVQESRLALIDSSDQYRSIQAQHKRRDYDARNAKGWIVDSNRGEYYTFQGERLETYEAVPRLLNEANALYLEELQKQNQVLYARLTHERELEHQAEFLVIAVRRASTAEERAQHSQALTKKLEDIFELKQQNRRDEIAQFEAELNRLKARVEKREELKDQIIEKRAATLTGDTQ